MNGTIYPDWRPVVARDGTILVVATHSADGISDGGFATVRLHAVEPDTGKARWVYGGGDGANGTTLAWKATGPALSADQSLVYVATGYTPGSM